MFYCIEVCTRVSRLWLINCTRFRNKDMRCFVLLGNVQIWFTLEPNRNNSTYIKIIKPTKVCLNLNINSAPRLHDEAAAYTQMLSSLI